MMLFFYIYLALLLIYVFFLMYVINVVLECSKRTSSEVSFDEKISVIVPFRNEKNKIRACINSILAQKTNLYFEVILVDDHSDDGGLAEILPYDNCHIFTLPDGVYGKKSAIEYGVKKASGSIIFTTDADCIVPENWINTAIIPFHDKEVQLSLGTVFIKDDNSFLGLIQSIESCILALFTKYGISVKRPILASGANLAYRKTAFKSSLPYTDNQHISSGDDMFLLEKIILKFGADAIVFNPSVVSTLPTASFSLFFAQRVRWFKKMKHITAINTTKMNVFMSLVNVFTLLSLVFATPFLDLVLFGLLLKYFSEMCLLLSSPKINIKHFLLSPVYFFWNLLYPVFMVVALLLIKPKWKGRAVD